MSIAILEPVNCDHLLEDLKGHQFFAIEIIDGMYRLHIPDHFTATEIIFGIEILKHHILNGSVQRYEENVR